MWAYFGVILFYILQITPIFIILFGWMYWVNYEWIAGGVYASSLIPLVLTIECLKRSLRYSTEELK